MAAFLAFATFTAVKRAAASWSGEFLVGDLHPEGVHQDGFN